MAKQSIESYINKIHCSDCLELMKDWPDNCVDLVVTSPPYNVGINYDKWNDAQPYDDYLKWCTLWIKEIARLLKKDGRFCLNHYLSCGNSNFRMSPLMDLNAICKNVGLKHHGVAIWTDITLTKRTAWGSWLSASAPYINSPYEGILISFKEQWKKQNWGMSDISKDEFIASCSGVWNFQPEQQGLTKANFPIELPSRCIKLLTYKEDVVFDCMVGSGTTCVAAKMLGRRYIGIDISEKYCEIARMRLKAVDTGVPVTEQRQGQKGLFER